MAAKHRLTSVCLLRADRQNSMQKRDAASDEELSEREEAEVEEEAGEFSDSGDEDSEQEEEGGQEDEEQVDDNEVEASLAGNSTEGRVAAGPCAPVSASVGPR